MRHKRSEVPGDARRTATETDIKGPTVLPFVVAALVVIAAGVAIKFVGLGRQSLWLDELYTAVFTQTNMPTADLYRSFWSHDVHPPLYYLLTRYWLMLVGQTDEFALRSFSALLAALSSAAAFFAFRGLLTLPGRLLMTVFVSSSFGLVYYGQEARSYALLFLLSLFMLATTLTTWRRMEVGRVKIWLLGLAVALSVLLSYTHLFGLLFAGGCWLTLLGTAVYQGRNVARVASAAFVTGAFVIVWPLIILTSLDTIKAHNQMAWFNIYTNPLFLAKNTAYLLFGNPYALALMVLVALLALFKRRSDTQDYVPTPAWMALLPGCVALVAGIAISMVFFPIMSHRNLVVLFPSLLVAMAMVVEHNFAPRSVIRMAPVLGAVWLLPSLDDYYTVHKTQWREAARYITDELACTRGTVSFFPIKDFDNAPIHRVYLSSEIRLESARSLFGPRSEDLGVGDLQWIVDTVSRQNASPKNDCSVLLWLVHVPTANLEEIKWPQGVKVERFFETAVVRRE